MADVPDFADEAAVKAYVSRELELGMERAVREASANPDARRATREFMQAYARNRSDPIAAWKERGDRAPLVALLEGLDPPPLEQKIWTLVIDIVADRAKRKAGRPHDTRRSNLRYPARLSRDAARILRKHWPSERHDELACEIALSWLAEYTDYKRYDGDVEQVLTFNRKPRRIRDRGCPGRC